MRILLPAILAVLAARDCHAYDPKITVTETTEATAICIALVAKESLLSAAFLLLSPPAACAVSTPGECHIYINSSLAFLALETPIGLLNHEIGHCYGTTHHDAQLWGDGQS